MHLRRDQHCGSPSSTFGGGVRVGDAIAAAAAAEERRGPVAAAATASPSPPQATAAAAVGGGEGSFTGKCLIHCLILPNFCLIQF